MRRSAGSCARNFLGYSDSRSLSFAEKEIRFKMPRTAAPVFLAAIVIALSGCREQPSPPSRQAQSSSSVSVTVNPGGPAVLQTASAEFDVLPTGYVQAWLLKDGKRLTLDEPQPGPAASGDSVVSGGKEIHDFVFDFEHARISDAQGKLGPRGKRVEIMARSSEGESAGLEETLAAEVYDDLPTMALTSVAYKNAGSADVKLDRVVANQHRLSASLAAPQAAPYDLWSFQGSSYQWGKDDVIHISKNFSQPN